MAGISSKALNSVVENKFKFNGIEQNTDLDLNIYDAFYRNLDPQIGRFWQIDPKLESAEAWSPYVAMLDNPTRYADPLGNSSILGAGFFRNFWEGFKDGGNETVGFIRSLATVEGWKNVGDGLLDFADRGNVISPTSLVKNSQTADKIGNYISNVPNMSKDQIGHDLGYGIEKGVEAAALSKGAGMVNSAVKGSGSATLFRAASSAEVSDMVTNGVRNTATGYETSKLFATSAADAAQYGKNNFKFDGVPNTVVKVKVPNSVMKNATVFQADGMRAVSIPANQLQKVKVVNPLNYTPKPTNPIGKPSW